VEARTPVSAVIAGFQVVVRCLGAVMTASLWQW
jgi:hypothetical protein